MPVNGPQFRAGWLAAVLALAALAAAAAEPAPEPDALTLALADSRLAIAHRLVEGGIFDRAAEMAGAILADPAAQAATGSAEDIHNWLKRREQARFILDRARLGLAPGQAELLDAAASLIQLANNRYRLPDPAYNVQAAYWAGRAFEAAGEYQDAVDTYSRVGGLSLPPDMEGDAAQRMSRCLRVLAEAIPYPGELEDRQRRDRLLNQAISELDRARLSFPVGNRRKGIELDLIALRLARREEQYVREAITEAESFIEGDPSKDEFRARAALYRGQASAHLGQPDEAASWFRRVLENEAPTDDDRRSAQLGLALALMERAETTDDGEKTRLLNQAATALEQATAGTMSPGPWDGARVVKANLQLELGRPTAALETLASVLKADTVNPAALHAAGLAEWRRGRLDEAMEHFLAAGRPATPAPGIRFSALRDGSRAAASAREYGLALALNHRASEMLRRDRLFTSLLSSEFEATETILKLGRMGGPVTLSGDIDLLASDSEANIVPIGAKRTNSAAALADSLGRLLAGGGDPDSAHDLAIRAEAAAEWAGDSLEKLELAIALLTHLRQRHPAGITDATLAFHLGEAKYALALVRGERILEADAPPEADIDRVLDDFAEAAAGFREGAAGGFSARGNMDQGVVNLESGAFLKELAARWDRGAWSALAARWRDEARRRIEASIPPFNHAIATSGPSSLASRRARWSRGRALELLGEWRSAAADFLSLMNNSELPRLVRANAARRWAMCMGELGESRQALTRLTAFADFDAEAALLAGRLAETAGLLQSAYRHYLSAADPDAVGLPPLTPERSREAAFRAARIALADPAGADPLHPPEQVVHEARSLLETNAFADLDGDWAVPALNLLGENLMTDSGGWRETFAVAERAIGQAKKDTAVDRAMHILAARALTAGGEYADALDQLDAARELLDDGPRSRVDAARVTLETARIYRLQGRFEDAVRAYTDVFAVYPDIVEAETAARAEAATMLLSMPDAGPAERERAVGILRGLRDQIEATRILRQFGMY